MEKEKSDLTIYLEHAWQVLFPIQWKTGTGDHIRVINMDYDHLINCLLLMQNRLRGLEELGISEPEYNGRTIAEWKKIFLAEYKRREMVDLNEEILNTKEYLAITSLSKLDLVAEKQKTFVEELEKVNTVIKEVFGEEEE